MALIEETDRREWLEPDGVGGFASGTVSGIRTRRYHGLLLVATTPPTGRMTLVNGFEAWVETPAGRFALSSARYAPDIVHPDGFARISAFTHDPWPTWTFSLGGGASVTQEVFVARDPRATVVRWTFAGAAPEGRLVARPLLSGRDYHGLHRENGSFLFAAETDGAQTRWRLYDGVPAVCSVSNGDYRHAPDWYRRFLYLEERDRGLDDLEDLATPGELSWFLEDGPACWIVSANRTADLPTRREDVTPAVARWAQAERKRRVALGSRLDRAADTYLVDGRLGRTIVAGYPWFTDWGRDTFIALRGVCLATGRLGDARDILLGWADAVSGGMLPNRFPDAGDAPEFNAVDASLWFVVAVGELLDVASGRPRLLSAAAHTRLRNAVDRVLEGYSQGTRYGIRCDEDGLLAAGVPGVQLTWMDAKVGDWVVTPRIGKPVEVNALWINALQVGAGWDARWRMAAERASASFGPRFWNEQERCLFDVIDVDHEPGRNDATIRPNQIFAVGGLPTACLEGERARLVVERVERDLLTPLGLRSLAPSDSRYVPRYEGGVRSRDGAYHQGTVWPWLIGPFVEAWVRVHGADAAAQAEARARFLEPIIAHLADAGLGHVSEIVDAEPPHTPRGCPFQAWSVGELVRLDRVVLAASPSSARQTSRQG